MILTVCAYGHSRSVAAVRYFHGRNIDAIACGFQTAGAWFPVLCATATWIVIMDEDMMTVIPVAFRDKVRVCHVGRDRWSNPYNGELAALVKERLDVLFQEATT